MTVAITEAIFKCSAKPNTLLLFFQKSMSLSGDLHWTFYSNCDFKGGLLRQNIPRNITKHCHIKFLILFMEVFFYPSVSYSLCFISL